MIAYLVNQIIIGKITYLQIVNARLDLKDRLDTYITANDIKIDEQHQICVLC